MKELEQLEIEIELKAQKYARNHGVLLTKCVVPGERDWPDRIGLFHNGHVFYIEFKRPGEEPRRGQLSNHKMLRRLGFSVYVCDNVEHAKQIIDKELRIAHGKSTNVQTSRVPKRSD